MTKNEFKKYLSENIQNLLFEHTDKISEMFDPFIEDDTIEEYSYEFNTSNNNLNIIFTFKDGETIEVNIGK